MKRNLKRAVGLCVMALTLPGAALAGPSMEAMQVANLAAPEAVMPINQRIEIAIVPAATEGLAAMIERPQEARPEQSLTAPAAVSGQNPYQAWVAGYISRHNKKLSWVEANAMAQAILVYSQSYGVDFRLLTGVIAVESSFRSDAVSSSGAIGLGQLKPDTAKWLGVSDPYNPVDNIAGTARFLGWLLKKYNGSLDHALSAYYQGPGTVDRQGITPACVPYLQKINRALGAMMAQR